jgi:hypothetical protein
MSTTQASERTILDKLGDAVMLRKQIDTEIQAAIRETAERCAQIAEQNAEKWVKSLDGCSLQIPVAAHACLLVKDKIRREFGLEEK